MNFDQAHKLAKQHANIDMAGLPDQALHDGIASITEELRGPGIGQLERLALHEERKAMRAELMRRSEQS